MEIVDFIIGQGFSREDAEALADRAKKNPRLVSCEWRGKHVRLKPPTQQETDRFNEMLASGQGPFLVTDSTYLEGTESTGGKKYLHQLAAFPGDPRAWVSGRGDVESYAREQGKGVEGMVTVPTPEVEPAKPVKLDPKIVERELQKTLKRTKAPITENLKQEMREIIVDQIGPKG